MNPERRLQVQLLRSAADALRPGGRLVYATCTFAPEENELALERLLAGRDDLTLEPLELPLPPAVPGLTRWGKRELRPEIAHARRLYGLTD